MKLFLQPGFTALMALDDSALLNVCLQFGKGCLCFKGIFFCCCEISLNLDTPEFYY